MNFGIEGLHMCTIGNYHLQETMLKVFQKYRQIMKEFVKDVKKEKKHKEDISKWREQGKRNLENHPL